MEYKLTSSKAIAGGIAGPIVTIALWMLTLIPGWSSIPDEPRAAITSLVVMAIPAGMVWLAPANAKKATNGQ